MYSETEIVLYKKEFQVVSIEYISNLGIAVISRSRDWVSFSSRQLEVIKISTSRIYICRFIHQLLFKNWDLWMENGEIMPCFVKVHSTL